MEYHQNRVIDEKLELDGKLSRLKGFILSDVFSNLPDDEKSRLIRQAAIMGKYSDVLGERIVAFRIAL